MKHPQRVCVLDSLSRSERLPRVEIKNPDARLEMLRKGIITAVKHC